MYIPATNGHTEFYFSDDVVDHVVDEILSICQEVNYLLQSKVERFGTNNPDAQIVNGCCPWAVEINLVT